MTPTSSFLIGLAGGSASGKSTFAGALHQALGALTPPLSAAVISTDAYFLPDETMPKFVSPTRGLSLPDYNRPDSIEAPRLLCDLDARRGAPAARTCCCWKG